jgi:nucleotide-binding universal stress UspA family protein
MRLLICSDGSEQAGQAVRLGALIAAGCQAQVTLLGIMEASGQSEVLLESLRRGQALLEEKGIRAELISKAGEPVSEIVQRTKETTFDLVVIGAVRKGNRGRFWMSSKTYRLIKQIEPPVLSVAGKCAGIRRALICSGGRRYIDRAVRLTGEIARGCRASVTLFHVVGEPPAIYAGLPRMAETADWVLNSDSELGVNLRHEKATLESMGVPTEVRLGQGSVLQEILREIRTQQYDLMVTGSALSQRLRSYVLGDISREIVNRVDCAVLVARGDEGLEDRRVRFRRWWARRPPQGAS